MPNNPTALGCDPDLYARVMQTVRAAIEIAHVKADTARATGDQAAADEFEAEAREAAGRLAFLSSIDTPKADVDDGAELLFGTRLPRLSQRIRADNRAQPRAL
jgi:hypothetical protein